MNKIYAFALVGAFCLTFTSCQKETSEAENMVYLEASACAPGYSPESKTTIHNENEVWWQPGDAINICWGSACDLGKFTALCNRDVPATIFRSQNSFASGTIAPPGETKYWAVHPYSAFRQCNDSSVTITVNNFQRAHEGSFDPESFPSVAVSDDMSFAFYNVCGGVRFTVTEEGIHRVIFKGNDGETLAGDAVVSIGPDGKPLISEISNESKAVSLTCLQGFSVGTWYYISTLPTRLDHGYTMIFEKFDWWPRLCQGTKISESGVAINRSVFGSIANADNELIWREKLGDEEEISSTYAMEHFTDAMLPDDNCKSANDSWYPVMALWDGIGTSSVPHFFASSDAPRPCWLAIDLGGTYELTGLHTLPRINYVIYGPNHPRVFEFWGWGQEYAPTGSVNSSNPHGFEDGWVLLGRFEQFKPSGYEIDGSVGTIVPLDRVYFNEGNSFILDNDICSHAHDRISYLRVVFIDTFGTYNTEETTMAPQLGEITLYGKVIE